MGSGVLFVALGLSGIGNEAAVAFRAGDLNPQIARYVSDQGQAAFANGRVALGSDIRPLTQTVLYDSYPDWGLSLIHI